VDFVIALDYTARIPPSALTAAGVSDVCRYLCYSPVGDWKRIRKPEYDELLAAGIGVTLNWELDARDWAHGEAVGIAHGAEAVKQARSLGYPAGCAILGSADFDMSRATWDSLGRFYGGGFAAAVRAGGYRPGVYGPWDVLTWVRDAGLMDVFWQAGMSTAWSGGRNRNAWPGVHLRQRRHITVGGQDCDANDILIATWGQARVGAPSTTGDDMGVWDELLSDFTGRQQGPGKAADILWATAHAAEDALAAVRVNAAAETARDAGFRAAFDAFATAVTSGAGGDIDVAPILARIDALATEESTAMAAAMAEIAELRHQLADRDARLAAALKA
jgi:hypothetical protein